MPQHSQHRTTQKHKPFTGRKPRSTQSNTNFVATVESVGGGRVRVQGNSGKSYPLQKGRSLKMDDIYPGVQVRIQKHKIVDILPAANQFGGWFW